MDNNHSEYIVQYSYSVRTDIFLWPLDLLRSFLYFCTRALQHNYVKISDWLTWRMSSLLSQDKENIPTNISRLLNNNIITTGREDYRTATQTIKDTTVDDVASSGSTPHKYPYSPSSSKPQNPNVVRLLSLKKSLRCLSDADILSVAIESSVRKTQEKLRLNGMRDTQEVYS